MKPKIMQTYIITSRLFITLSWTLVMSCFSLTMAQDWTWVKGANSINQLGVYGTKGIPSNSNNPSARRAAVTWTDTTGNFWLLGGIGYDSSGLYGRMNDLWRYDVLSSEWTWMHGENKIHQQGIYGTLGISNPNNTPGGRDESISWVDNNGDLWFLGGFGVAVDSAIGSLNDLWKYTISTNEWTWMGGSAYCNTSGVYGTQGIASTSNNPGSRAGSVGWTDNNNTFWLMGGLGFDEAGSYGLLNDVWQYSPSTGEWTWMKGSKVVNRSGVYGMIGVAAAANTPGCCYNHACWSDTIGNLWMIGGYGYNGTGLYGLLNDLWHYNISTNEWTWVNGNNFINVSGNYSVVGLSYPHTFPGGRSGAITWMDKYGKLWLLGGYGRASGAAYGELNDLWQYDISTDEWAWVKGTKNLNTMGIYGIQGASAPSNMPGGREKGARWIDKEGDFWLMGGYGYASSPVGGAMADLWECEPNQLPVMQPTNDLVFCQNTSSFSIPLTISDLDNDSLSFIYMILNPSVLHRDSVEFVHLGGDNYEIRGTLVGNVGVSNFMIQVIDGHGGSDYDDFLVRVEAGDYTRTNASLCFGDSLWIAGEYQYSSGIYYDTLSNNRGCDSIVETNLSISPLILNNTTASICQGAFYFFDGNILTTAGTYYDTLIASNGCDSIVILDLIVLPSYSTNLSAAICQGASYAFGSNILTSSGVYYNNLYTTAGCDSIIVLNLTVYPIVTSLQSANICDGSSYIFGGNSLTIAGTYFDTLVASNGCDSILELTLNVHPVYSTNLSATICAGESYNFEGNNVNSAGTYTQIYSSVNGCDSIITLDLTVLNHASATLNESICQGSSYIFGGNILTTAGTYTDTLVASNGCDSVLHLNLNILLHTTVNQSANICDGSSYIFGGNSLTIAGTYFDTLMASNGCDSILELTLNVHPVYSTSLSATICVGESYNFEGNNINSAGTYTQIYSSVNGCDSIITLDLTVLNYASTTLNESICQGSSYIFGGNILTTAGTYTDTLVASNGCDSVLTLSLMIIPTINHTKNFIICAGESVWLAGGYQNTAGIYYDTLVAANGCDSVVRTNLTVNPVSYGSDKKEICEGDVIWLGGAYQSTAGLYIDTLIAVNGCDSIVSTQLQIEPSTTTYSTVTICWGDSIWLGGAYQSVMGIYQDTLSNRNGCDSIVVTQLFATQVGTIQQSITICEQDSIFLAGAYQTNPGVYLDTLPNPQGCYSVLTTTLSVQLFKTINIDKTICVGDSIWIGNAYQSTTGIYTVISSDSNGCQITTITNLRVNDFSQASLFGNIQDTVCLEGGVLELNTDVTYFNIEIVNGYFNPISVYEGDYTIMAKYEDTNGCLFEGEKTIFVQECTLPHSQNWPYFNIYPSPSNGQFTVDIGIIDSDYYKLIVVDELGRVLHQAEKTNLNKNLYVGQYGMDISHLNSGVYIARLLTETGVQVQKIKIVK